MRYKFLYIGFLFSILIFAFSISSVHADETATKIEELRAKIEELTRQSREYQGTVLQKQQEAESLKKQIDILNSQIKSLQAKIGATTANIDITKIQITELNGRLFDAEKKIEKQKAGLAEALVSMNNQDNVSLLAILFKNPNLSNFMTEAQQISNYNNKLNSLLNDLKEEKNSLEDDKSQLENKQVELEKLSINQTQQKQSLSAVKGAQSKLLSDTKGQEAKYQQLLTAVEKQKAEFFAELLSLESKAIQNGTVITRVTATAVPSRGTKIFSMPYDKYYLTQSYGRTSYARRGAYGGAIHNGVDIVSGYGNPIQSIGSGTVLASGNNIGFGNWVAVKHDGGGGMVSVYGHMINSTIVRIGASVDESTVLGFEGSSGNSTGSHLHLSLYRDFFTYINSKNDQLYFNYADGSVNPLDYISQ